MKRRFALHTLFLSVAACSTAQEPEGSRCVEIDSVATEFGAGGAIFPAHLGEQVRWLGYTQAASHWKPTESDVAALENSLRAGLEFGADHPEQLDDYAIGRAEYHVWIHDRVHEVLGRLPDYRRQYLGLVDGEGRRKILLRGFPGPAFHDTFEFPRWQAEVVIVNDGGSRYWYVVYDLQSGELHEFHCNGEA